MREKIAHEEEQLKRFSEMARIPEGTFLMGRNGVNPDEEPAHPVYLQAFDINKYEVTQIQFLEVMETNPSYFQGCPLCPVEKVTFYQAEQYCLKVGKRLPTEAEWEKAARGGTATVYSWGNDRIS
ncbi:MAG: SUMF1/EgtB/PvdO family nonheme iron enzyme, partial [Nitrospinaceae bacterium]|nr:formylglycine-generating enzyme family protein [Nitrospinaceae bacterium]NIR57426.1 formylglycine-generating enzyme family protein [Nitrospinaceae bacterium]NIS87885.1 formylglycine-generating enzyme family protein [Nitrospinaceae bacterium]NIT84754.1 formylglycine-generating enzyme family protein [Nitrospinaceae bacterium]NIU46929.1 formylglycine-generating enzyme family protein [Nitrospinaceae bacterium]